MCGIVGYVGSQSALDVVMAGLKRLEYRGYDSAGVAVLADGGLAAAKKAGKLVNLEKELVDRPLPTGVTGIGHTRWATHGGPTDANAHPHLDNAGRVSVVHNGIIENFAALRGELAERGHTLASETDTEVVAHLLAEEFSATADLAEAMRLVCRRLEGAFTLVAVHADEPDVVVGARRNSPLVVGVGEGEAFLASDVAAFIAHTRSAIELGQDQVVELRRDGVTVTGFDGHPAEVRSYHVDWDASAAEKGGYDYFMLKEIAEQPKAVADTLLGRIDAAGSLTLDEVRISASELREVDKVVIVACGTAFHAGLIAKYAIEHWTRIPCEVELASEFRYRDPILDSRSLVIAISQSGETMDTLMALRHAREQGSKVLATPTGPPSPGSPTPCCTRTPGPRSPWRRRRRSSPSSWRATWSRCTSGRCGGPSGATRSPPSSGTSRTSPVRSSGCWRRWSRCGRSRGRWPTRRPCCSWGGTSGIRWPSKGR
jgi:glucosamine--fructose-6-phosphate aminotransferase (isomerizing)